MNNLGGNGLVGIDYVFLALFFCVVAGIGYFSSKKSLDDSKSYFLGGGSIGWLAIGASLFASNISAEHFIGLSGSGASSGLAVGQFEWLACFILLLLGWVFVPFYLKTGVFTMPEFLQKRYNSKCRMYLSTISIIAYIFTKISVALYAGATVLNYTTGLNIYAGAILLVLATGLYTAFGGLRAVIYVDLFQASILVLGGITLTAIAVSKVGGLNALFVKVPVSFFNIWKPMSHPEFPWTGILFGAPILGIWYWCTDQVIVQRTLAAKGISDARRATVFAGFLKILPVFILVLPGIAGYILFKDLAQKAPNDVYANMVRCLLPPGVKGLVVAGIMAALISTLASTFNSSSTLITMDFYKKFRPKSNEKELVRVGQISTGVLVVIGILWIPFIKLLSSQLFVYLQSVQAYISPPIAAVFLAGITWKRVNGTGAFSSLVTGFLLGGFRFVTELGVKAGWIKWAPLVSFASINFLHFAILLFVVCSIVLVAVSYATAPPKPEQLEMVFKPKEDETTKERMKICPKEHKLNIVLSLLLVLIVLSLWFYFSPIFFSK